MSAGQVLTRFDSLLDVAVLQVEMRLIDGMAECHVVFCWQDKKRDDFQFHIQLPDGRLVGNYGGIWGCGPTGAAEYAGNARALGESRIEPRPCSKCGRSLIKS